VKIPTVSASASRDAAGKIHISLVNTNPDSPVTVSCEIAGDSVGSVTGRILTAPSMTSHNTFDAPHAVQPGPFTGASVSGNSVSATLPPLCVVVLEL
jgi:alpha-N-arabinofuranosidase